MKNINNSSDRGFMKMTLKLLLLFSLSLTACKEEQKSEATSESTQPAESTIQVGKTVSSLSKANNCDDKSEGALVFDRSQNTFFTCLSSQWTSISLQGTKGDLGSKGDKGDAGTNGLNGNNGKDGHNGRDGTGFGLVLRDTDGVIRGHYMGMGREYLAYVVDQETNKIHSGIYRDTALLQLPSGDYVYVDLETGEYAGGVLNSLFFESSDCTGDAISNGSSQPLDIASEPRTAGRIFFAYDINGNIMRSFRVSEKFEATPERPVKRRSLLTYMWHTTDQYARYATCILTDSPNQTSGYFYRAKAIPKPTPSLTHLAPIKFTN